jgi:type II secretory pathway component PulJ
MVLKVKIKNKLSSQSFSKKTLSGFTIMELSLYITILAVMTVVVANTFVILTTGGANVEAKSELNSNFRFTIEKIKRDVSAATAIASPATAGANSTLLDITVGGQSIKYAVTNNRISRQVAAQAVEYISSDAINITNLNFLRLENSNAVLNKKIVSVEISITGEFASANPVLRYSQSQKTTVDLNSDL